MRLSGMEAMARVPGNFGFGDSTSMVRRCRLHKPSPVS